MPDTDQRSPVLFFGCLITAVLVFLLLLAIPFATRLFFAYGLAKGEAREALPIEFYGRVVDGKGEPLPGAEVEMEASFPNWPRVLWAGQALNEETMVAVTDGEGRFSYHRDLGSGLRIRGVKKPGYRWVYPKDQDGNTITTPFFDFSTSPTVKAHVADAADPYTLRMEREEE